jgi:hypothetical protein
MNLTAAQTELATQMDSDLDAMIEEACRLHDEAVAACYAGQGYKGEKLFHRALALFEQTEAPDHPDVAAVLGNLGAVYDICLRFGRKDGLRLAQAPCSKRDCFMEHCD